MKNMILKSHTHPLYTVIFILFGITKPLLGQADLVPTGNNAFYYKMGGGQATPVPAYNGASSVPLDVNSNIGLGYNCGLFNPKLSITDSLNAVENSFQNIEQSVVQNATSAIAEFPMYAVARADPDLYNLLNNALLGARKDLSLSTKSCQVMQSEIAQGKNPYTDWATLSMGNDWQQHMSLTSTSSASAAAKTGEDNNNNDDINLVSQQIAQDNGNNGVPWIHGENNGNAGGDAGGQGQPAILVINDTSIAGYNVILQAGRNYDDTSAPSQTPANAHLVTTWANPQLAANWITTILGDEKITTYASGDKQSTPGVGLLPQSQQLTTQVLQNLQGLVSGQTPLTVANLQTVSAPGVMINTAVIKAIQQKDPVTQAILINKLSEEVATAELIDQALLAKQILQEGSQVPAIYSNKAAQEAIKNALERLDQAINNLLFNVHVRKELVSDTATQLLEDTQNEQASSAAVPTPTPSAPVMSGGAVKTIAP